MMDSDMDQTVHDDLANIFFSFQLADESYALEIQHVAEIIDFHEITDIPDMSEHIKGVINRRGNIIPVIDLRLRIGLPFREYDKRTCIIIVHYQSTRIGLIVDRVNDSFVLEQGQIADIPEHSRGERWYISGIGHFEDRMEILLNLQKVLSMNEQTELMTEYAENTGSAGGHRNEN